MKRNRATRRKPANDEQVGVLEFFFVTEKRNGRIELRRDANGHPMLRKDPVTRAELWGVLDWFWHKTIKMNAWHRRLGRWLKGLPFARLNPFAMVRSMTVPVVIAPAPAGTPEAYEQSEKPGQPHPARRQFDASGRPVE